MSSPDRDITRRYLVTVGSYATDDPPDEHLSVLSWNPTLEAWLHGQSICGRTVPQGEMDTGVTVTCPDCLARKGDYAEILAGALNAPQKEASDSYFCPSGSEVESPAHGGFDVCCGQPDRHIPLPPGPATDALSAALSRAAKDRYAAQVLADDAWGTVWLHCRWEYLTKCMTTPEREYAADCVARWSARLAADDGEPDRGEPEGLRWWRD